jgi:predicted Zn-dependent protease
VPAIKQPDPRLAFARTALQAGREAEAREMLRPLLDQPNPSLEWLGLLAGLLRRAGDGPTALRALRRAELAAPGHPGIALDLCQALIEQDLHQEALERLEAMTRRNGRAGPAGLMLGMVLVHLNRFQDGLDALAEAPDGPARWDAEARARLALGDIPGARDALGRLPRLHAFKLVSSQPRGCLPLRETELSAWLAGGPAAISPTGPSRPGR